MLKWLEGEVGVHIRAIVITFMCCATVLLVVFLWPVKHEAPLPPGTVTATPAAPQYAKELQAAQQALATLAAGTGSAPIYQQPAIAVIRDVAPGITKGLTDAQIGQLLAGLKKPTQTVYRVSDTVTPPSPVPKPSPDAPVYDQAYAADVAAITATKQNVTVHVDQEERAPSRIGTIVSTTGAGIDYALIRRGHFDLDLGVVTNASHLSPMASLEYMIPHTSVGCGPSLGYNHGARFGAACSIKF